MAGPPADKEEDPDDSSSAAQGSAAAPRGDDARVVGSGDGDRRMLVRPGRSPGRAPARTRVPDPGVGAADGRAERPGHDQLRPLHAGAPGPDLRPDSPGRALRPQHRDSIADRGEPARVQRLHALSPADHPDEERARGGRSRADAARADRVCAVHARSRHQHARPHPAGPAQPRQRSRRHQQLRPLLTAVPGGRHGLQALPARRGPRQRDRSVSRGLMMPAALVAAGVTGVVATVAFTGGSATPAAAPRVRVSSATVTLTNLTTTTLAAGTLGYAAARPLTNQVTGTYTFLPAAGSTIGAGDVLYRVDNQPVIAMRGRTPAWRPMVPGISGPDVAELQANLIALGYASGLLSAPTGYYDLLTAAAVQRWQVAAGTLVTGQVGLGQVVFVPATVRVGALRVSPVRAAYPRQEPYQVTTTRRNVSVPVNPSLPPVTVGERVSIVLPSLVRTPGRVTAIGPPTSGQGTGGTTRAASGLNPRPYPPPATRTRASAEYRACPVPPRAPCTRPSR